MIMCLELKRALKRFFRSIPKRPGIDLQSLLVFGTLAAVMLVLVLSGLAIDILLLLLGAFIKFFAVNLAQW